MPTTGTATVTESDDLDQIALRKEIIIIVGVFTFFSIYSTIHYYSNTINNHNKIYAEEPVVRNIVPLNIQLMLTWCQGPIETLPSRDALLPTPPGMGCRPCCFLHQY
jgi:hypothetical protein